MRVCAMQFCLLSLLLDLLDLEQLSPPSFSHPKHEDDDGDEDNDNII